MGEALAKKTVTYQDIIDLPENVVGEILEGELVVSPRPAPAHAIAYSSFGSIINGFFQRGAGGGPGGWWIIDEPELHFSENVLVPDIGGWRKERMPTPSETAYFELSPDWVCEIVSPSSARHDRITKANIYARENVPFYWILDPTHKTLECLELKNGSWLIAQTFKDNDQVAARPFDAVTFGLDEVWGS